jgi:hypothetical protein
MKNPIGNRTHDFSACSSCLNQLRHRPSIGCTETSVRGYNSTMCTIPDQRRSHARTSRRKSEITYINCTIMLTSNSSPRSNYTGLVTSREQAVTSFWSPTHNHNVHFTRRFCWTCHCLRNGSTPLRDIS